MRKSGAVIVLIILALGLILVSQKSGRKGGGTVLRGDRLLQEAGVLLEEGKLDEALKTYEEIKASISRPEILAEAECAIGDIYKKKNNLLRAQASYRRALFDYPQAAVASRIQERLWDVNLEILFSPIKTEDGFFYEVKPGDSLYRIAQKHNTTVDLLLKSNNLSSDRITPGMKLKIMKTRFSVVVNTQDNTLTLKSGEEVLKVYPVSTGKNNSTPIGEFKIVNKLKDPPWYKPGAAAPIPPESPENILGSRWLGMSVADYGIHGTIDPESIGGRITEGCIRMRNPDVEEIFIILPVGTEVIII